MVKYLIKNSFHWWNLLNCSCCSLTRGHESAVGYHIITAFFSGTTGSTPQFYQHCIARPFPRLFNMCFRQSNLLARFDNDFSRPPKGIHQQYAWSLSSNLQQRSRVGCSCSSRKNGTLGFEYVTGLRFWFDFQYILLTQIGPCTGRT